MFIKKERQIPINEILARTKSDKIGLSKRQVSTDEIMGLLSGNRGQIKTNAPSPKNVETQYEEFIKEAKEYTQNKPTQSVTNSNTDNKTILNEELIKIKRSIRGLVSEEVNSILFNEIFSQDRLRVLIENTFKDVIERKAKEILIETFRKRKEQSSK